MMSEKLNREEIMKLLPHRDPMLLIDELINIKKLSTATAIVNVKKQSFFVQGHFPGQPVVPGVILFEMMAQTAAALIAFSIKEQTTNKIVYLMNIEGTKFRKPVFPNTKIFCNFFQLESFYFPNYNHLLFLGY